MIIWNVKKILKLEYFIVFFLVFLKEYIIVVLVWLWFILLIRKLIGFKKNRVEMGIMIFSFDFKKVFFLLVCEVIF